jgi:hypothetical protein
MRYANSLINSKKLPRPLSTRYFTPIIAPPPLDLPITNTASQFKEDPDAWLLVDKILQEATYPQTKCMFLDGR